MLLLLLMMDTVIMCLLLMLTASSRLYFMHAKSDIYNLFCQFKANIENLLCTKVKILRSDGAKKIHE